MSGTVKNAIPAPPTIMRHESSRVAIQFLNYHPSISQELHELKKLARKACKAALRGKKGEALSIVLADDEYVQQLNKQYRGKDKPTNVLSFPADAHDPMAEPGYLGDMVISIDTLKREATVQGKKFDHHYLHLVVHGMLHLLGYDHEVEQDAQKMESLEIEILKEMGIPNPYL